MEKNKIKSLKFLTLFIAFLIITIVNNCHKELYAEGMRDLVATEDSNGVWNYNKINFYKGKNNYEYDYMDHTSLRH